MSIFLALALTAQAQVTLVQAKDAENAGSGSTLDVVLDSNQTAGNANIVSIFFCDHVGCADDASDVTISVTDDAGNTYSLGVDNTESINRRIATYYDCSIAAGANTVHITLTGTAPHYVWASVSEWDNVAASDCLDQTGKISTTGANPSVSTSGATTQNNELVYGLVHGIETQTADETSINSSGNSTINDQYKTVMATGVQTLTWTAASGVYWANILTFKEAGGGPAGTGFTTQRGIVRP